MEKHLYSKFYDTDLIYNHSLIDNDNLNEVNPHSHDTYEILFFKDGDMIYTEESKSFEVKRNDLILIRPGKIHSHRFTSKKLYDRYDIIFDRCIFPTDILDRMPENINVISCDNHKQIVDLFKKMDFYYDYFHGNDYKSILVSLIQEVFFCIIAFDIANDSIKNNTYNENPVIAKAVKYIEKNISTDFSLQDLCNELHITKSYLYQLFTDNLHTSPKKFIVYKRLTMAQKTVRLGSNPTDIYANCGFSDYTTFYRSYKKHFGYPPSEERNHSLSVSSLS